MNIYRGPKQTDFCDNQHALVDTVTPDKLKSGIIEGGIECNISKKSRERQSVCNIFFEDEDLCSVLEGVGMRVRNMNEKVEWFEEMIEEIAKLAKKNLSTSDSESDELFSNEIIELLSKHGVIQKLGSRIGIKPSYKWKKPEVTN